MKFKDLKCFCLCDKIRRLVVDSEMLVVVIDDARAGSHCTKYDVDAAADDKALNRVKCMCDRL